MSFRELPSIDQLLQSLGDVDAPHSVLVNEARRVIASMRDQISHGVDVDSSKAADRVRAAIEALKRPSLRRVIHATGVILHTNLGRAPSVAFAPIAGYSNLEYDLAKGRRGKRDDHLSSL